MANILFLLVFLQTNTVFDKEITRRFATSILLLIVVTVAENAVVAFTALFSDISFSYDEANEFVRGPLGFTPHICSGIYLLLILILSAQFFKERHYMEAGIILAIFIGMQKSTRTK